MKKIKLFNLIVIFTALISGCIPSGNKTKTSGEFEFPVNTKIALFELKQDEAKLIDSVSLKNESEFEFTFQVEYPTFYMLKYFDNEKIYLICHPGDNIKISIENNNTLQYYIDGSFDSKLLRDLVFEQEKAKSYISNLSDQYNKAYQNAFADYPQSYFDSIYNSIIDKHKQFSIKFINSNIESLASIFALYQDFGVQKPMLLFDKQTDIELFSKADSVLMISYPNTDAVIALNKDVVEAKERKSFNLGSGKQLQVGKKLPNFNKKTITGSDIEEAIQGKMVVYYVFAVWDKLHIDIAKQVNEFYIKNRKNDVEVVGISLDKSISVIEEYLKNNRIKFPVICDELYWDSPFVQKLQIQNVPAFLVVDKNGFLISNQLKPDELQITISPYIK